VSARLSAIGFRLLVLVAVWLLGTSTLSLAQDAGSDPAAPPVAPATADAEGEEGEPLVVPDVRGMPYVFAKGVLEDEGFAWKVEGKVEGFAVNLVATQSPKPGTQVVDTGAPTAVLTLARNPGQPEEGLPQNESPYPGTTLELVSGDAPETSSGADAPEEQDDAEDTGEAGGTQEAEEKEPAGDEPAATTGPDTTEQPASAAAAGDASADDTDVEVNADADVDAEAEIATRPPAFHVPGAPEEPLDEMPLPRRANLLGAWLADIDAFTPRARDHFTYQHAWIVTGATFGWWRGEEALRILIDVDQDLQKRFGVGAQFEAEARDALEEVLRKSRPQ
jgi:hypothetical protein